jgi:hypothetical protein
MIERLARRWDARGQFYFATEAAALIPAHEDYVLAKSHRGLHMLAREERSLHAPARLLHEAYGPKVVIHPHSPGAPVTEARIGIERRHLVRVRGALQRRGVNPSEEYAGVHYCVLRFEAPPADLLGLPVELDELTGARCTYQVLLTGYR